MVDLLPADFVVLVQVIDVASSFDSERVVDLGVAEEEKQGYFGLLQLLCHGLDCMPGLDQGP